MSDSSSTHSATPTPISHFLMDNGMEVVVIPDHRAPVVTHMVWYRNGSVDDPLGQSGIAHFLEHLMFKGTAKHALGEFSEVVAELGGQENAFTSYDYTAYYQRIPKAHLRVMMEFEADRMLNLQLTDEVVDPERDVVLEERRMRTDADPSAELSEAIQAALYTHHPYGTPIIGWEHEIASLSRQDALDYYVRFYTPENSILVVAGDVTESEVREAALATYGMIPAREAQRPIRRHPQEPPPKAHRLVTLRDEKVEQPCVYRVYLVPSSRTGEHLEPEALELFSHILGGGPTSRLYRALVLDQRVAVAAGAHYIGQSLADTRLWIYATPAPNVTLPQLDEALRQVLIQMCEEGVTEEELARAKTRLIADVLYAQDSQTSLAQWYGSALAIGHTVEEVRTWPDRLEQVTRENVRQVGRRWLTEARCVTGFLEQAEG